MIIGMGSALLLGGLLFAFLSGGNTPRDYVPSFSGGPHIEIEPDFLDYGYVKLNTVIISEITIRNVGDEPLHILGQPQVEVREGC